jgi:hypothetical protein
MSEPVAPAAGSAPVRPAANLVPRDRLVESWA